MIPFSNENSRRYLGEGSDGDAVLQHGRGGRGRGRRPRRVAPRHDVAETAEGEEAEELEEARLGRTGRHPVASVHLRLRLHLGVDFVQVRLSKIADD